MDVPVFRGTVVRAEGHLGKPSPSTVDGYAPAAPSSRLALAFEAPRDNAASSCDLILDLTGGAPLFPAGTRSATAISDPTRTTRRRCRRPVRDRRHGGRVREAALCPLRRRPLRPRAQPPDRLHPLPGRLPASAITSAGDTVAIDPYLCGGCGGCASVCPTGAASYQMPAGDGLYQRLRTLLAAYREAGGREPVLLLHDPRHGAEAISLIARAGRGLPGRSCPSRSTR